MYKKSYSVLFLLLMFFCVNAQKFTPDTSKSGNLFRAAKVMTGFVNGIYPSLPLITTVIPSTSGVDPKGTQIYVTGDSTFYIWSGTQWIGIERKNINWSLTGNNGTVAGTNFIGTTDGVDWVIKTNNTERARITSSGTANFVKDILVNGHTVGRGGGNLLANTSLGYLSLQLNSSGINNTAIGYTSLRFNTSGFANTAIGFATLPNNLNGYGNTAGGFQALYTNMSGYGNAAYGDNALFSNTGGYLNVAVGSEALYTNTNGFFNVAVGRRALRLNITGYNNTAIGSFALDTNSIGYNNTAIGHGALFHNVDGHSNTANGYLNLYSNLSGRYNTSMGDSALISGNADSITAIGFKALALDTLGIANTGIGAGSMYSVRNGNRNTSLGQNSLPNLTNGNDNIGLGPNSGAGLTMGNSNTFVGIGSTGVTTGSGNVLIGNFISSPLSAATSNHYEARDNSGNLAFSKDANGLSRINVQALQTVNVSAAATLTLNNNYSDYVFTGITTTWTLPPISGFTNVKYFIKNRGSGDITLNSNAGGNDIYITSAVNTYTIAAGGGVIFMCDGTYWNRIDD